MRRLWASVALVTAVVSTGCSSDSLPARITSGAKFATVVRLPGGSTKQIPEPDYDPEPKFDWATRMEFRLPKDGDGVLLLRAYVPLTDFSKVLSGVGELGHYAEKNDYGDRAFVLESNGGLRARQATEAEWTAAAVVQGSQSQSGRGPHEWESNGMPLNGAALDDHGAFLYAGKRFPHHTTPWRFMVSPQHRRVAVLSSEDHPSLLGSLFSDHYTYFLDIFDLGSGGLVSSLQGKMIMHEDPGYGLKELTWVTDRYFYLPLSAEHDNLLMFDFGSGR